MTLQDFMAQVKGLPPETPLYVAEVDEASAMNVSGTRAHPRRETAKQRGVRNGDRRTRERAGDGAAGALVAPQADRLRFTLRPRALPDPDPPQAFLASEHRQHVENPGRGRAAGQRGAQRLGDDAELRALFVGVVAHRRLRRGGAPLLERLEPRQQRLEVQPPAAGENLLGLGVDRERPFREQETRAVGELDQRLGALLQAGQGGGAAARACARRARQRSRARPADRAGRRARSSTARRRASRA